ncbi:MAG TPA: deoxyribonuclease II family protein, partial [Allosphingosinicella sp.]|nr:deoxyribonuclease II family protein [Allosphingosinicella sp.]
MRVWGIRILAAVMVVAPGPVLALQLPDGSAAAMPPPASPEQPASPDWIFIFKLNARSFPSAASATPRPCPFGGTAQPYSSFSQNYVYATSVEPILKAGPGLIGTSLDDPLGAVFAKIWNGNFNYVVWNDQFYQNPLVPCAKGRRRNSDGCGSPWGHSKGVLAWDDEGEGVLLQVTTPSWPAAAATAHGRPGDGNTLGCILRSNNLKFSQHFFTVRLSPADVGHVVDALANASVVTDVDNPVLVRNGGPEAIRAKVAGLGHRSSSTRTIDVVLSTGVRLIGKPSKLNVPPWQFVSARLGGIPLRTATWWANPNIPTTTAGTAIACWDPSLPRPGAVEIATSGQWA